MAAQSPMIKWGYVLTSEKFLRAMIAKFVRVWQDKPRGQFAKKQKKKKGLFVCLVHTLPFVPSLSNAPNFRTPEPRRNKSRTVNSLGACVRGSSSGSGATAFLPTAQPSAPTATTAGAPTPGLGVASVTTMEDVPPPPPRKSSLSIDRAAFLLLRVKKAFKKKRQQRKDKLWVELTFHMCVCG